MARYLFYTISGGAKLYFVERGYATSDRTMAAVFTDDDYEEWGKASGVEREDASGYEEMCRAGAPMLPGIV